VSVSGITYGGGISALDGVIDSIGYWDRALTQDDVDSLYAGGSGWESSAVYATLQINDGPNAGQYIVLKRE
jgi:hypothetical protein